MESQCTITGHLRVVPQHIVVLQYQTSQTVSTMSRSNGSFTVVMTPAPLRDLFAVFNLLGPNVGTGHTSVLLMMETQVRH